MAVPGGPIVVLCVINDSGEIVPLSVDASGYLQVTVAEIGIVDASSVTYTPAVLTDWDGDADPGDVDEALDQLAERTDDLEALHPVDAGDVTYTPGVLTDWDGDADPGEVDEALDQLAERVDDLETAGGGGTGEIWVTVGACDGNTGDFARRMQRNAYFNFAVPSDFSSLIEAKIVMICQATETLDIDIKTDWGAHGDAYNANSDSVSDSQSVTNNDIHAVDFSDALTGISAGVYVGVNGYRDSGTDPAWLGILFRYNKA